ncbi:MAG: diguanylate cyclase [Pseudomonadota bacterium]
MSPLSPWILLQLLSLLILSGIYIASGNNRSVPGQAALRLLLTSAIVWAGAKLLLLLLPSVRAQLLLHFIAFCCASIAPLAWLGFALAYGTQRQRPARSVVNSIGVLSLLFVSAAATNPWHGLMWAEFATVDVAGHPLLTATFGPLYLLHFAYSTLLILSAITIIAYVLGQTVRPLRPLLMAIGIAATIGLSASTELRPWTLQPGLDLVAPGYALALLLLQEGMIRPGYLNNRRIARDQIMDILSDGVLVLNADGIIVDANASGLAIAGMTKSELNQRNIKDIITTIPFDAMNARQRRSVELTLDDKAFEVNANPLNPDEPGLDKVLVFRDVTRRRKQEYQLKQMQQELEQLAHTDPLTRLCNRRIFMTRLDEEVERVRRHGSALSVILFDLDHFKAVNDTHGHDTGDRVLKTVAQVAEQHIRVTDVAARIGGEEFALLLPETAQEGAIQLANRLREAIQQANTVDSGGQTIQVTASIGVATVGRSSRVLADVLKQADEALYDAKHLGRNRVCIAEV